MSRRLFLLSFGVAGAMTVGSAVAGQHEGHQAGATPSAAQVTECRQAQPVITELLNAALKRLEEARLTNSAAAMRDAADDVQTALVDMRTQFAPCSAMQAAATAPAGQVAPAPPPPAAGRTPAPQPGAAGAAPAAADPHARHATPTAPPASSSRTPAAAPARPSAPSRPAPVDAHGGHVTPPAAAPRIAPSASGSTSAAAPPTSITELKCSNAVDPKTAPRMLYQGRMYYFCTEASRAEFAKDPSKVVTTPSQAAPAHAH